MRVHNWMLLVFACALAACGGGGSSSAPGPQLTALSVGPTSAYTGSHPGTLSVSGTVRISGVDANGLQITLVNANGIPVAQAIGALSGGPSQGLVGFSTDIDISTLPAGAYEIDVQATSPAGGVSNVVGQAFQLIAYPWRVASPMPHVVSEFAVAAVGSNAYVLTGLSTVNGVGTPTAEVFGLPTFGSSRPRMASTLMGAGGRGAGR